MMSPSACPLPEPVRAAACEMLNGLVAFAIALHAAAYKAHHNVAGPMFGPLHDGTFKATYERVDGFRDALAERVKKLGGMAIDTLEEVAAISTMTPFPTDLTDGIALCRELADRTDAFNALVYEAAARAEAARLVADVSMLGKLAEDVEDVAWRLRKHTVTT